jgi:hypothetical protein
MTPFHQLAIRLATPLSRPIRILMACSFAAWMSCNLTNPAIAQERLEQQIAEMKEKLHRESQGLKQHIAELMESGQVDKAEATKRELANFQQSMEEKIHATAARLDSPEQNPQRAEAKRRPKERELKAPREEANPETGSPTPPVARRVDPSHQTTAARPNHGNQPSHRQSCAGSTGSRRARNGPAGTKTTP